MILTKCAVCATDLELTLGKKCGRCSTRYCGPACQKQHWQEFGHDQLCKRIKKEGGAEQYNANTRYTAAVSIAAEACAEDTKGQTCHICTQALHWKTKEGLVRMCGCSGTSGFAHVSCLEEQAKILVAEAEANNLGDKAMNERWERWHTCGLCEQQYHGVVIHALGWACWKTYLGRLETDETRRFAMSVLGLGLTEAGNHEDALSVQKAELAMARRLGASEHNLLVMQGNLANTYRALGRFEHALRLRRDVYAGTLKLHGEDHAETLVGAYNYAVFLSDLQRHAEARSLLRKTIPVARRVLGDNTETTFRMRLHYEKVLYLLPGATLDDLREVVTTLAVLLMTARRVFGAAHPLTVDIESDLRDVRVALRAREAPPSVNR